MEHHLIRFNLENFLSFRDKEVFTFFNSSDDSLKEKLIIVENEKFTLSPVSAIYGANAFEYIIKRGYR